MGHAPVAAGADQRWIAMYRLSIAFVTGILASASVAAAADLPSRMPAPIAPLPVFTWTGFYVGANAGAAFNDTGRENDLVFAPGSIAGSGGTNGTLQLHDSKGRDVSFTGGGQIGYNYQFGAGSGVVVGIEADAQYASFGNRSRGPNANYTFVPVTPAGVGLAFAPPGASVARNGSGDLGYFGTVRGRVGYAFSRYLAYATGGFAYGGGDTDVGYAAGGGLEYAVTNNISVKVEGLYVNLSDKTKGAGTAAYNVTTNVLTVTDKKQSTEFEVARVGINYRF